MANGKGPLLKFRAGAISCALWESEANVDGQMKTIPVTRPATTSALMRWSPRYTRAWSGSRRFYRE